MRYLVLRYEYNTTAQAENRQLYAYDTEKEAVSQFHSILYQDMNTESISKALCMVITEQGVEIKSERYEADVEETTDESTDTTES